MNSHLEQIAQRLRTAGESCTPCAPVRDIFTQGTAEEAYAAQEINTKYWLSNGRRLVGRKIGLTSKSVQAQLGVDQPDYGMLFADMACNDHEEIDPARILQPRIEVEVAFVIASDLTRQRHTVAEVMSAVAYVLPALEVVGSRIAGWDIRLADTIADNASSGLFVLGTTPRKLSDLDLSNCGMVMERGAGQVSVGSGRACLGNPVNAVRWLADVMVQVGRPLAAGDIVLSGALGPMVSVMPNDVFEARVNGLGSVRAVFGGAST